MGVLIKVLDGRCAHHREPILEICQILPAETFLGLSRTPGHDPAILSNTSFVRLCGKVGKIEGGAPRARLRTYGKPKTAKPIQTLGNALSKLIRARESSCNTRRRGDLPLDARHFRRRECMATGFDSRNVAGHCTKENRFKGGNQESRLAIGTGTQQQPFPTLQRHSRTGSTDSLAWVRPPFAILLDRLSAWHFSRCRCLVSPPPSTILSGYSS
jgi:hypothetical protein